MELIAVPTGVNNRVAAYAFRGGSVFDRRDFYIGAALVKHPQGDLLVDAGFGRDIGSRPWATSGANGSDHVPLRFGRMRPIRESLITQELEIAPGRPIH